MKDGDTTFVTIYQRINDSTLIHKATLSNLYPLYFKEYVLEYDPPKDLENIFLKLKQQGSPKSLVIKNNFSETHQTSLSFFWKKIFLEML